MATLVRLIELNLSLLPTVIKDDDAKLLPSTSVLLVKLAPNCSISRLLPADRISLDFLSKSTFPETPYLNWLSLKP